MKMDNEEKYPYNRYVENRRIEMGVLDTAKDRGKREAYIQVALGCLEDNLPFDLVVKYSHLLPSEVRLLAERKDIDAEDETS